MSAAAPSDPAGDSPRAKSVELFEESLLDDLSRQLGTFQLRADYGDGDGEIDRADDCDYAGVEDADDGVRFGNFDEDSDDPSEREMAAKMVAEDARLEAAAKAREEAIDADPLRRLPIDDAIELARTMSDHVTVWLDHEPWDASDPPRGASRTWPPNELNLRPRWYYERADTALSTRWWVQLQIEGQALTPELIREALAKFPRIAEVREPVSVSKQQARGRGGLSGRQPGLRRLDVDCLIESTDATPATETFDILEVLSELVPEHAPHVPLGIRLRMVRDLVLRRQRGYTFFGAGVGISPRILRPESESEVAPAPPNKVSVL